MQEKDKPKEYLRINEASELLGVHPNTLRNWDNNNEPNVPKPVKVGVRNERRYRRTDIIKYLEENQQNQQEGNK